VREFIRESWKTASAFAAGAFLLSTLIGLTASNPFGVVIFRAFLLGLFFAGLGAGLRWAVRTWLAEPAAARASEASAGAAVPAQDGRGSRVDITLGEDADPGRAGADSGRSAEGAAEAVEDDPTAPRDDSAAQAEAAALGELSQELGEDPSATEEEAAGVEEMEGDSPPDLPGPKGRQPTRGRVDSLPDISLDEPPARPASRARRSRPETPGEALRDAVRDNVARQDPATLARALRTVLKKEEKG
jgi:hypothetical protein